jgi:hypothetical protein
MAIHRRARQAGRKIVAHVRGAGRALQRRPKDRGDVGDPQASALDERLSALAAHIDAGRYYESPWQLFCYGHLKGLSDEEAVKALAAWCKRQGLEMSFVTRRVGSVHVVCLVLKLKRSGWGR